MFPLIQCSLSELYFSHLYNENSNTSQARSYDDCLAFSSTMIPFPHHTLPSLEFDLVFATLQDLTAAYRDAEHSYTSIILHNLNTLVICFIEFKS